MHFNFHLSGDESAEQTRRIANAVLALGGATLQIQDSDLNLGEELLTDEAEAFAADLRGGPERERTLLPGIASGAKWVEEDAVTTNVGESPSEVVHFDVTDAITGERKIVGVPPPATVTEETREDMRAAGIENPSPVVPPAPLVPGVHVSSLAPLAHAVNAATFDSKGLPWDERIHSGSRKFNADGSWRYRKNVPEETKAAVEGELRELVGIHSTPVSGAPLPPRTEAQTAAMVESYEVPTPIVPPAPPLPPVVTHVALVEPSTLRDPNTVVSPPAPPTAAARTYPDVVNLIMKHKITPETYVAIIGSDLPTFAATCKTDPNAASVAFDALELASRT